MIRMNDAHEYFWDDERVPGVNEILKDLGIVDTTFMTEDGAEAGKRRHKAIEDYDNGCLDWSTVEPDDIQYVTWWSEFLADIKAKVLKSETMLYCDWFHYAGTADKIMMIDGVKSIVDIKTGSPSRWHKLQIDMYAVAWGSMTGDIVEPVIVYLREGKRANYRVVKVDHDMHVPSICRTWMWKNKKWSWLDEIDGVKDGSDSV